MSFLVEPSVLDAESRIRSHVRCTPLDPCPSLSDYSPEARVFLKLESEQLTGSFKVRGAFNKLLQVFASLPEAGIVTASTGNHGLATACALHQLGKSGTIVLPTTAAAAKVESIRHYNPNIIFHGSDCVEAENFARVHASDTGKVYVSPYNDYAVVAGQGTIGLELMQQLPEIDFVFVPVGGGGLIGGIAAYLKAVKPSIQVVGCLPANSPVMKKCVEAGRILDLPSEATLSDATAGGIEEGSVTLPLCERCVDEWVVLSEQEICDAMYLIIAKHHKLIEGAAGTAVAAFIKLSACDPKRFASKNCVIVVCGANLGVTTLQRVLNEGKLPPLSPA